MLQGIRSLAIWAALVTTAAASADSRGLLQSRSTQAISEAAVTHYDWNITVSAPGQLPSLCWSLALQLEDWQWFAI